MTFAAPAAALALAAPFWDTKPPADWSLDEVRGLLTESPWAQRVEAGRNDPAPPLQFYVASAEPIVLAEDRMRSARRVVSEDPSWAEYRQYLLENTGKFIVVAVSVPKPEALADNSEMKTMENQSRLRIGKRKYKLEGHFTPSSSDPFLRFVFPRDIHPGDRTLEFDLYVPGSGAPFRQARFALTDMLYHGQPAL